MAMKPDVKDATIRVAGLLQAIIHSGTDPKLWDTRLERALKLHHKYTRALLNQKKGDNAT